MRFLLFFLLVFSSHLAYTCECAEQNFTLELYKADIAFTGNILSKVYDEDSLHYTITFEALSHFKSNKPEKKTYQYRSVAEGKYTGIWTSCDWYIDEKGTWLIMGKYTQNGLIFDGMCGFSRRIDKHPISKEQLYILEHIDEFKLREYRFHDFDNFTSTEPLLDTDTIIRSFGSYKQYIGQRTRIIFDIDNEGLLEKVSIGDRSLSSGSSNHALYSNILPGGRQAQNEFEDTVIALAKLIRTWKPVKFRHNNIPVKARKSRLVSVDSAGYIQIHF